MSGPLSAVTNATPLLNGAENGEEEDARRPLLAQDEWTRNVGGNEDSSFVPRRPTNLQRTTRQSDSHLELRTSANTDISMKHPVQTSLLSKPLTSPGAILRPLRPTGCRSVSNTIVETRSRLNNQDVADTPMQREIMARLSKIRALDETRRHKVQCNRVANPGARKDGCTTNLKWRPLTHSSSDPYLRRTTTMLERRAPKPLKTCLKQKSRSADATPTNGMTTVSSNKPQEDLKLRRRKTVDFAEAVLEPDLAQANAPAKATERHDARAKKYQKHEFLCPGISMLSKCSLANPAVTRTDVHVIAITPSSSGIVGSGQTNPRRTEGDPATPTMQIVESNNGSYEIVWEDVPPDYGLNTRRRSSAACEALGSFSTSSKGLERVNTKLTEWSGTWNTPSDHFKPTIVVFPDDDGQGPRFDCAVVGDEDIEILAPPNSERASVVHSRHASRPSSVHMPRTPSQDESHAVFVAQDTIPSPPGQRSPIRPDPEAWPAHRLAARRKPVTPNADHKLSDIEEADIKFRDHRDSVTLAHSRLINSGGVRPELFAHRDSVTLAKKRMYARNHTTSTARKLHRLKTASEPGYLPEDDAAAIPQLSVVKAQAFEALRKEAPSPILRRTDDMGGQRIHIED